MTTLHLGCPGILGQLRNVACFNHVSNHLKEHIWIFIG